MSSKDGRPRRVSDDELVEAVRELVAAGETDLANGGVHPSRLADHVDHSRDWMEDRCRDLAREGRLERVRGLSPTTLTPRSSYRPADGEFHGDS